VLVDREDDALPSRVIRLDPVQYFLLGAPTTHFVILAKQILYRGVGIDVVWWPFLALAVIGTTLFGIALARFRKTIGTMA
jgi:ABC-2 type transport system permease protein